MESTKGGPLRIARNDNRAALQDISRLHDLVTKRKLRSASCAGYSQLFATFCISTWQLSCLLAEGPNEIALHGSVTPNGTIEGCTVHPESGG